ncbi:MAG TPA: YdeI/OmpD-associated family protein [Bacteroidia bacterium]|jgi:hypothetical protein
MTQYKFKTKLEKIGTWTFAVAPIDVKKEFGSAGPVRVKGKIDDYAFAGVSLMPMGNGKHCLAIKIAIRKALKKEAGATVMIVLEKDTAELEVPFELKEAFEASPEAKKMFDSYSYSNKKYYTEHVNESKKQETRDKRAVNCVLKLEKLYFEKHG